MAPDSREFYFYSLCKLLTHAPYGRDIRHYSALLQHLYDTEFIAVLRMDENRIADAMDLRYLYECEDIQKPISVFEVMIALARRIEIDIMRGTASTDRTVDWFWVMIDSLGLSDMTDEVYDATFVAKVLRRFMRRRYFPNGKGGLFTISDTSIDMREVEIWYQAAFYLNGVLKIEGFIEP